MKLLWIFRAIFLIVIMAVIFVNISAESMTKNEKGDVDEEVYDTNLNAICWSGLGMKPIATRSMARRGVLIRQKSRKNGLEVG